MNIQSEMSGNTLTVKPEGRLDTLQSPQLEKYLKEHAEQAHDVVMDLEKVDYISSAGLRVLIQEQKRLREKKGGMVVRNVCESVMNVLELTGFVHVLTIE